MPRSGVKAIVTANEGEDPLSPAQGAKLLPGIAKLAALEEKLKKPGCNAEGSVGQFWQTRVKLGKVGIFQD